MFIGPCIIAIVEEWKTNTYQLQQGDKTHHTKHTTTHRKGTLIAKTSVFTAQDDRCGNSSTKSHAPEDGYINVRNMLSA